MHVYEPTELQTEVLLALDPERAVSLVEVAECAGISVGAARSRLTYLELKGCVTVQPKREFDRNWWVLTARGAAFHERLSRSAVAA